jgi:iron complex outermembrane receptor protein
MRPSVLLYANISRGYKAGAVPVLAASTVTQFVPVPQESLLAYESGFKASLFDRRVQLNASAFYYDYEDKQLRGAVLDPTFGPLEALVSIPKSHVKGAELQLVARLAEGLIIDTSAIYVETEVDRFVGFDARAQFGDQSGTPFPYSPKWQSITNVDYKFQLFTDIQGFVGGSLHYNGETFAGVGALDLFRIGSFTLLDLRAGVELGNERYRVWAWGKNVTNEYYWSNVFANGNAVARFVGQPATYGVSLSARF